MFFNLVMLKDPEPCPFLNKWLDSKEMAKNLTKILVAFWRIKINQPKSF